jgi:hypothetical protein
MIEIGCDKLQDKNDYVIMRCGWRGEENLKNEKI